MTLKASLICLVIMVICGCENNNSKSNWNDVVNSVASGVVAIQIDVPVSFDGKRNFSNYGTGFIVDSERGIILTNRHIVTPGPVTARAILINNEEIDLHFPHYFEQLN